MGRKLILLTIVASIFAASNSQAQTLSEGEIVVIQPRPVLVEQRLELIPRFGVTFNDPVITQFHVGGSLYFHIAEEFHFGGTFEWYDLGDLGGTTAVYDQLIRVSSTIPEIAPLTYYAGGDFGWVPIRGKLSLFDSLIVYYDFYAIIGAGVVESVADPHPAGTLAFGQRIFIGDFLDLTWEIRDRMYIEPLPSGDTFTNILTISIGLGVFIPPSFDYDTREERILDWE